MAYHDVKTPWEGWRVIDKIGKGGFGTVYEIAIFRGGILLFSGGVLLF